MTLLAARSRLRRVSLSERACPKWENISVWCEPGMAYSNGSGGRRVVLGSLVLLLGWTKNAFGLLFGGWEG